MGVFLVVRTQAPSRHPSRLAAVALRLEAKLRREGATNVQCGWTGCANDGPVEITCSGTRKDGSGEISASLSGDP